MTSQSVPNSERALQRTTSTTWQAAWSSLAAAGSYHDQLSNALRMMTMQACPPLCGCRCHKRRQKRTPPKLKKVAGTVSIGYQGSVLRDNRCDSMFCTGSVVGNSTTDVTYVTPPWLAHKAARLVLGHVWSSSQPTRALTVQNVRDTNDELFCAARLRDPSKLMRMLRSGKGRPSDVDADGENLLHTAIRSSYSGKTVRYLLSVGADPHCPDLSGMTPYDRAYEYIIKSGGVAGTTGNTFYKIFPDMEPLSSWGLTKLHKIILGMNLRPLDQALCDPAVLEEINKQDTHGRTALWWAVDQRRHFNAPARFVPMDHQQYIDECNEWMLPRIEALLEAGADPNLPDSFGDPPLRQAMIDGWLNLPMMRLLASYGANLTWCNGNKMTSLHVAARYHQSADLMDLLATAPDWKKNLNALGGLQNKTPLQVAIHMNLHVPACWLIDHGADIELEDRETGESAVLYAIDHSNLPVLKHLLSTRKPDLTVMDSKLGKNTILMHAAARGTSQMLNILASHRAARNIDFGVCSGAKKHWHLFNTLSSGGWESEFDWDPPHIPDGGFARDTFWRLLNTKTCERCALDAAAGIPAPVGLSRVGWRASNGWNGIEPSKYDDPEERAEYVRWLGRITLDKEQSAAEPEDDFERESSKSEFSDDEELSIVKFNALPPHGPHVEDDLSIRHLWIDLAPPGRLVEEISEKLRIPSKESSSGSSDDETESDTACLLNEKNA